MKPYVYIIRNKLNNKLYIGSSAGKVKNYMSSSKYVKNDIIKYGMENFEKTILNFYDTYSQAKSAEDRLNDDKWCKQEWTYNKMPSRCQGGWTEETASYAGKIGQASLSPARAFEIRSNAGKIGGKILKGKPKSESHKANLSKLRKGKNDWLTDEWKNNIAKANKKRFAENKDDILSKFNNKGRIWMNKEGQTKMIQKHELSVFLNNGWSKGRR
jgi:hypothetical protein